MNKLLVTILPLLTLGFMACEKDEAEISPNTTDELNRTEEFSNPHEWVGVEHNNMVQYLMDIESDHYTDGVSYVATLLDISEESLLPLAEVEEDLELILNPEEDYLASLSLSVEVMDVFTEIETVMETSADRNHDFDNLAEATFYSEEFSIVDKDLLLGSIAVAKHSSNLWEEEAGDAYGSITPGDIEVALADVEGFVTGIYNSEGTTWDRIKEGLLWAGICSYFKKMELMFWDEYFGF